MWVPQQAHLGSEARKLSHLLGGLKVSLRPACSLVKGIQSSSCLRRKRLHVWHAIRSSRIVVRGCTRALHSGAQAGSIGRR